MNGEWHEVRIRISPFPNGLRTTGKNGAKREVTAKNIINIACAVRVVPMMYTVSAATKHHHPVFCWRTEAREKKASLCFYSLGHFPFPFLCAVRRVYSCVLCVCVYLDR